VRFGNVEDAFQKCAVIVEKEYRTPVQEHAFLQPESGVAYLDNEGRITVIVGGQWAHEDQEQIAHALNLPAEKSASFTLLLGCLWRSRRHVCSDYLSLSRPKLHEWVLIGQCGLFGAARNPSLVTTSAMRTISRLNGARMQREGFWQPKIGYMRMAELMLTLPRKY